MVVFVAELGMRQWVWGDWKDQYSTVDEKRVRVVAHEGDRIVGCVDVGIVPNSTAGVNYISVADEHRHKQIGSHLLRIACRLAEERGGTSMFAGIVHRSLYEKNGWRVQREFRKLSLTLRAA